MKKLLLAGVSCVLGSMSYAQEVAECDWRARADAIVEPWEEFSRTFANGDVRLALVDAVEPAAGALHILVISPPYDEIGARQCRTIGFGGGIGFSGIAFEDLAAAYDPSVGLIFEVPVDWFDGSSADFVPGSLLFTLNQATGEIGTWLE